VTTEWSHLVYLIEYREERKTDDDEGGGGKGGEGGRGGKQVYTDYISSENQAISFSVLEYISWAIIYATKFIDCFRSK
jgi:hypothetical protein